MARWGKIPYKVMAILVLGAIGEAGFQACSPVHLGQQDLSSLGDPASIAAFESTLFPVLRTNCSSCHGVSQVPMFAVSDAALAHGTLLGNALVDLNTPANSRIVSKISQGHSGLSTSLASTLETQIAAWDTQFNASGGGDPGGGGVTPPPGGGGPVPLGPTYAAIAINVLIPKCVGCHGAINPRANVRLDNYTEVVKSVVAGNPAASRIYIRTSATANPMPPAPNTPLTAAQLQALSAWISAGALNN